MTIRKPASAPITPAHGSITTPKSRATFAEERGQIEGNLHNGIESGKFFPETSGGITDPYAKDDVPNMAPPADGKIASGERPAAAYLDKTDIDWDKHDVISGTPLEFVWQFSARHKYRRFNYFITKDGWDHRQPLAREQFESKPFKSYLNERQPYWGFTDNEMWPEQPTVHKLLLPERKGYHVLLGVWEIAETDKAFYQVVDLNFVDR
ncbi:chitin-binding protein [Pseudomonas sp. CM25]|uniref:lytic polysaccharide monooxygenase auxiliary activity family 9 protein n=1 Tax=Pseudomonas sp. CM25 TaxID=2738448 RepID=UPI0015565053|nr:lytic polysaccharide monooxygenase auxiliary activity family 9 protein [Pseudomonas sp. CM25]NQD55729.1 chitin-binding protein [Pseudomonas sp. CM25]HEN8802232.1 lytic polysaccharide monooxygenase [Pseudomonas putida]